MSNSDSVDLQTVGVIGGYWLFPFRSEYTLSTLSTASGGGAAAERKARWRTSLSLPRGKWTWPTRGGNANGLKRHSVHAEPRRSVMKQRQNQKNL